MANQVTDNRTDIADGTAVSGYEDIAGSALAVDTDIRYDTFSGSIGNYATTSRDATMYNNASTGLFSSGDHAYLLINCGVVSLIDSKASSGLTVRVTGATLTDWAEFDLFGSDEWPVTFDGGWAQIVVDIDELLANPSRTNGSAPTVGNIQRFGVTFITASVMPRMTDNFWVGGFRILGASTPAIIVEGRDGGASDWDYDSIRSVAAVQLSAVLKPGPGGSFVCRGPIQFGINDTSTHAFTEANKTLLWDFQEVMLDGFYGLSALGNSGGTTDVDFGLKSGSGDDATAAQGGVIQANPLGARWAMDFNDPNVDSVNLYGVVMQHGGDFLLDDPAVEVISSIYLDCTSALVSNSLQLRNKVIDANTADDTAFMITDDFNDIRFCEFEFSDGSGVEITDDTVDPQTSKGNKFSGYGGTPGSNLVSGPSGSTDAAMRNNAGAALQVNITEGGDSPSVRNVGASDTTTISASVTITLTFLDDLTGNPIEGLNVILGTGPGLVDMMDNLKTNASGIVTTSYSGATPDEGEGFAAKGSEEPVYERRAIGGTVAASTGLNATIRMTPD